MSAFHIFIRQKNNKNALFTTKRKSEFVLTIWKIVTIKFFSFVHLSVSIFIPYLIWFDTVTDSCKIGSNQAWQTWYILIWSVLWYECDTRLNVVFLGECRIHFFYKNGVMYISNVMQRELVFVKDYSGSENVCKQLK